MVKTQDSIVLRNPAQKIKKVLNIQVQDGIISLGKRGAGKTTLVEFLIESLSPDFHFAILDVVGNLAKYKDFPNVKYFLINPHNQKEVNDAIVDALAEGGLMLVLDEADRYSLRDKSVLSDAINIGRNYLVGYIATARRTANIDKDFLSNADWAFLFKHTLPQDIDVLIEWFSVAEDDFKQLQRFEFILFHGDEPVFKGRIPYEGEGTETKGGQPPIVEKIRGKEPETKEKPPEEPEQPPEEDVAEPLEPEQQNIEEKLQKRTEEAVQQVAQQVSALGLEKLGEIEGVEIFETSEGYVLSCKIDQWFKGLPIDANLDEAKDEILRHLGKTHESQHKQENVWVCDKCGKGTMQRASDLDEPFSPDTFGGEGIWEAYKCNNCGYVYKEPID
jgi:energy-coupling factor transporter ATP-binding protein EcfA2